ncbi:MAG: hypothetical protein IJI98_04290 [Methanosphaera sp.]|nr:hypothetical protein [Methanosphaera sp.]
MTIINVENPIFTPTREFNINIECLTDNLKPVTTGRIACILNKNILLDIKEVTSGTVKFNIKLPDYIEPENEYMLRFSYSGSIQAEQKTKSVLLLFNKSYEQKINAEIIVDDYYCKREETVLFKSYIKVQDNVQLRGKAVLKLDEQSLSHTEIVDNRADFEVKIPNMILDEHTLLWKYGTNEGIFVNTSTLQLEPRTSPVEVEYHENKGVSDEIREILREKKENSQEKHETASETSFTDKIRKLF